MSTNQAHSTSGKLSSRLTRRTSMACLRCRHRKVKCKPTQDHPERRCERCIKANLDCTYIPVAAQEIQASLRDQVVVEGNFNFRKVDVPDGTIQVFLGDQGLPFEALPSIPTYQQTPFNAWPTVYDIAPRAERDNTVYGAASPYGHNFQQGVYGTHDGRHPASDSHAVDSWLGQVYDKSHHYQPRESFPPSASTGSSSAAGANSTSNYNLYVAPIEMRWPMNRDHTDGQCQCQCPQNCQCQSLHSYGM